MKCLSVAEACDRLRISNPTLWRMIKAGELATYRPTPARCFIPVESIEAFEAAHTVPARKAGAA